MTEPRIEKAHWMPPPLVCSPGLVDSCTAVPAHEWEAGAPSAEA